MTFSNKRLYVTNEMNIFLIVVDTTHLVVFIFPLHRIFYKQSSDWWSLGHQNVSWVGLCVILSPRWNIILPESIMCIMHNAYDKSHSFYLAACTALSWTCGSVLDAFSTMDCSDWLVGFSVSSESVLSWTGTFLLFNTCWSL